MQAAQRRRKRASWARGELRTTRALGREVEVGGTRNEVVDQDLDAGWSGSWELIRRYGGSRLTARE